MKPDVVTFRIYIDYDTESSNKDPVRVRISKYKNCWNILPERNAKEKSKRV